MFPSNKIYKNKRYYSVIFLLGITLIASQLMQLFTSINSYYQHTVDGIDQRNVISNHPPPTSTDLDTPFDMDFYMKTNNISQLQFKDIKYNKHIYLYCGDLPKQRRIYTKKNFIGLTLRDNPKNYQNKYHISHDITNPFDIFANSVDIVQSEDVTEHIPYNQLTDVINEIYRVLKANGLFRLSMPDYGCDILYKRANKTDEGKPYFDIGGGGEYDYMNGKVIGGGHQWFPKYETVWDLLSTTKFNMDKVSFLHYYDGEGKPVMNEIDYSLGYITRTPDNDERVQNPKRPMSIVVDLRK